MTASKAWLDDARRVYPVTVDPDFEASGTAYVLYPYTGDWSVNDETIVGTWDNGGEIGNSFFAFDGLGAALAGERITSASLNVFDRWASTCSAEPFWVEPITQQWSVTGSKSYPGPSVGSAIGSVTGSPGPACTNTSENTTVGTWMSVPLSTGTLGAVRTGGVRSAPA